MSQLVVRLPVDLYQELTATAARKGETVAQVTRDVLEKALPALKEAAARHELAQQKLPHGVSNELAEEALLRLCYEINEGEHVHLRVSDFLTPRSKAIHWLLTSIWRDDPNAADEKVIARIAARAAEVAAKRPMQPAETPQTPETTGKRMRSYRRKGSGD
jgi:hypothetical protein